jgi:hypothetical protein
MIRVEAFQVSMPETGTAIKVHKTRKVGGFDWWVMSTTMKTFAGESIM